LSLTRPHSHQTLKKDEFYALLSVADLAVITPLRDGMNTTIMEFVIAHVGFSSSVYLHTSNLYYG
jgi:trehalose-6-phosphate synthase